MKTIYIILFAFYNINGCSNDSPQFENLSRKKDTVTLPPALLGYPEITDLGVLVRVTNGKADAYWVAIDRQTDGYATGPRSTRVEDDQLRMLSPEMAFSVQDEEIMLWQLKGDKYMPFTRDTVIIKNLVTGEIIK